MRETSKMLGRIICQTIQWDFYYTTYLKKNFSFVFGGFACMWPCERQIFSSEMRTTVKQVASCILNKEKPFTLTSSFFNLIG